MLDLGFWLCQNAQLPEAASFKPSRPQCGMFKPERDPKLLII
jgi:hypothetical protein